ncbi:sodium:dicarboxylate symporter [Rhizobium sp. Leaf384]|uniref:thiol:disulfide interchange protein TlpA n=1 Tax=unclassified Rhizobium TaxID=2613769 RepID=UPI00071390F2|nr:MULTISPECIES: TlpA disulfide reductase family protein [unclassified Rhizobium]KQS77648.1 sodium:dicarboxylate symporter [Rhizobium sp. Leaf384]KQS84575.1 sodium:dicarboxylate symporter [Rhizobium sp. Leaf383]
MTDPGKPRSALRLVALAALLGLIAGAAAVYVRQSGSGNAPEIASAGASGQCAAASGKIASLTPLMKGQVAAMAPADRPRPLEDLTFKDGTGKDLTLADFKGRTVLLNLWATWCVPCREEMPALDRLEKAEGSDRFEVVAVNIDTGSDEKPKAFLSETGVAALKPYRDASMGVFNALKKEGLAFGLPVTVLLDEKGCLLSAMNGPAAWDGDEGRALVRAAASAGTGS